MYFIPPKNAKNHLHLSEKWCQETCYMQSCHRPSICKKLNQKMYACICLLMFQVYFLSCSSLLSSVPSKISRYLQGSNFYFPCEDFQPPLAYVNLSYSTSIILSTLFCNLCLYIFSYQIMISLKGDPLSVPEFNIMLN